MGLRYCTHEHDLWGLAWALFLALLGCTYIARTGWEIGYSRSKSIHSHRGVTNPVLLGGTRVVYLVLTLSVLAIYKKEHILKYLYTGVAYGLCLISPSAYHPSIRIALDVVIVVEVRSRHDPKGGRLSW